MSYFTEGSSSHLTFTRRLQGVRRHIFKCVLIILTACLIMFTVASHVNNWYTVHLDCSNVLSNGTESPQLLPPSSASVTPLKEIVFGVSYVCIKNATTGGDLDCKNFATFDIAGIIPMDETKKLLALVIVFNTFALIMVASTTYCNAGVTKTAVIYISLGCMAFTVVCATYGMEEAFKHFDDNVIESLQNFLGLSASSPQKCKIHDIQPGHCYRTALAATVLMYIAVVFYVIDWKFPKEVEVTALEKIKAYRLMSKTRGSVV